MTLVLGAIFPSDIVFWNDIDFFKLVEVSKINRYRP